MFGLLFLLDSSCEAKIMRIRFKSLSWSTTLVSFPGPILAAFLIEISTANAHG